MAANMPAFLLKRDFPKKKTIIADKKLNTNDGKRTLNSEQPKIAIQK
jgi:hypothetical protein